MSHISAEFYRGAVEALDRGATSPYGRDLLADYRALLAEAEAREALQGSKEKMALSRIYELASRQLAEPAGAGDAVAMAKICTEVEAVHLPRDVSVPTAAEVIEVAKKALEAWREVMNTHGEWDDGCFYYSKRSTSELEPRIERNYAALAAIAAWEAARK